MKKPILSDKMMQIILTAFVTGIVAGLLNFLEQLGVTVEFVEEVTGTWAWSFLAVRVLQIYVAIV